MSSTVDPIIARGEREQVEFKPSLKDRFDSRTMRLP